MSSRWVTICSPVPTITRKRLDGLQPGRIPLDAMSGETLSSRRDPSTPPIAHRLMLALLLALGLAMRIFGAWTTEFAHTSDHGIICLMVKHMLEGRGFPVFFYGHPYMGNLEPALSALLCRLFGLNGFWINMGTALVGFAFLPLLYRWGRSAAGSIAGLAALAFAAIGPPHYFQFVSWADGGYAAIPFLTCAVLILTFALLDREQQDRPPPLAAYAALGLVAGLGWWQSPLIIPAFATSALLVLHILRRRLFSLRPLAGLIGFFLGSAPLWVWNFQNRWHTFDMVKTHDRPGVWEGLKIFYLERVPTLLELPRLSILPRVALSLLLLLLTAAALGRLYQSWREQRRSETLWLGGAVLFLLLYSVLFGFSRFARVDAMRYVIVLIPILGVLWGAGTAWLADRLAPLRLPGRLAAGIPLSVLILLHAMELPKRLDQRRETAAFLSVAEDLGDFLRKHDIRCLYTDYQVRRVNHGLNFILREEFVFSPPLRERYAPYAEAMELAERPAVLNNCMGFRAFLDLAGGSSATAEIHGIHLHFDSHPPPPALPMAPHRILAIEDQTGDDQRIPLTDAHADTQWGAATDGERQPQVLVIRLEQPARLVGFRAFAEEDCYPATVAVEGWEASSGNWKRLVPECPVTRYFWSGPRFYWGGDLFRLEVRFPAFETDRLKVTLRRRSATPFSLMDLQLLEEGPSDLSPFPTLAALQPVADRLRVLGIRRLYADRWEANQLRALLGPSLQTPWLRHLKRSQCLDPALSLDTNTALLVRAEAAESTRQRLTARFLDVHETAIGPWVLFDFRDTATPSPMLEEPGIWWTGLGVLERDDAAWAAAVAQAGNEWIARGEPHRVIPAAQAALRRYPWSAPLYHLLAEAFDRLGDAAAATASRLLADQIQSPSLPLEASFRGGPTLLGLSFPTGGEAGRALPIRYYWSNLDRSDLESLEVRVHVQRRDETILRDDHPFPPAAVRLARKGALTEWVEVRSVSIPGTLPAGETLQLVVELARIEEKSRRLTVNSPYREGCRAVRVPIPIHIQKPMAPPPLGDTDGH